MQAALASLIAKLNQVLEPRGRLPSGRRRIAAWIVPLFAIAGATLVKELASSAVGFSAATYLLYFLAVFLVACLSFRAGLIAAFGSMLVAAYLYLPPERSLQVTGSTAVLSSVFLLQSCIVVFVTAGFRRALARASERQERLDLLAGAGESLAGSLGSIRALEDAARRCAPGFSDICAIEFMPGRQIEWTVVANSGPVAAAVGAAFRPHALGIAGVGAEPAGTVSSNSTRYYPSVTDSSRWATNAEHRELLRQHPIVSAMSFPLSVNDRVFGAIGFARLRGNRAYTREDFAFGRELARRLGAQIDRARLFDEAQAANRAKDEFLGMLSHELRTPITVISGGADMVSKRHEQLDQDDVRSVLRDIRAESERLGILFDNLLTLAAGEDRVQAEAEPCSIAPFLERCVLTVGERTGEHRIRLSAEKQLPLVEAVPTYLEQVLRNLLSNALKYTPRDTAIDVRAEATILGNVAIRVLDRGPGVPEHELERIFQPYFRSAENRQKAPGFGVGLAVSRRLCESMGGRLSARLRSGGGLEMTVELPALAGAAECGFEPTLP